jgi:hypothetical protein
MAQAKVYPRFARQAERETNQHAASYSSWPSSRRFEPRFPGWEIWQRETLFIVRNVEHLQISTINHIAFNDVGVRSFILPGAPG